MQYTELGKTGLKVSRLGFGAMRLPMVGQGKEARVDDEASYKLIHRAFELGINYFDTAVFYLNSDGQRGLGAAIADLPRDEIILSTKNHYYEQDESAWWKNLEDSLRFLGIDYIDVYNNHGMNKTRLVEAFEPRIGKWLAKAKDQGLIRHICCSFHDDNEGLMRVVNAGYHEAITLQYNMLDRQLEQGIAAAREKGIGVICMGPVAGGALNSDSEVLGEAIPGVQRVAELALRFVWSNPNVTMALSGMNTIEQIEENCKTISDGGQLGELDVAALEELLARLAAAEDLRCTTCTYCQPCPQGVGIPSIFVRYNRGRVYGMWDTAKADYASWMKPDVSMKSALACNECGVCEPKCPQKIPIRQKLKEAHKALAPGDEK